MNRIDLNLTNFKDRPFKNIPILRDISSILMSIWTGISDIYTALASEAFLGLSWGQVIIYAATIGYSIYSAFAKTNMDRSYELDGNGQLINTRQSSDPIRIVYGLVKTGGVWCYSQPSRWNNNLLNCLVTWGEGEISGFGTGIDSVALQNGTGLNDISTGGEFAAGGCSCNLTCHTYTPCSCNLTFY